MAFPCRHALRLLCAAALALAATFGPAAQAQTKVLLRLSTPAVPDDWHGKMWTVFKDALDKSAPGEFDVQINLNATLFKQGTGPAAMARGNLELSSISAFDIAKQVPEFSIFTAGYVIRDPQHPAQGGGGHHRLLQGPGPDGEHPCVAAFRRSVQAAYAASDIAMAWPKGLLERINATR